MTNKNVLLGIIVILVIGLVIAIVGWINSSQKLADLRSGADIVAGRDSLTVCEDIQSKEQEADCVSQLTKISSILRRYERVLKNIEIPQ